MGPVKRPVMLGVAFAGVGLAWFLGASATAAALAAVAFLAGAWIPHRGVGFGFLLAAPIVLSLGAPLESLASIAAPGWLLAVGLACAPLFLRLGGGVPWSGAAFLVGGSAVAMGSALASDWAPSFLDSDIATRSQILFLGVLALVLLAIHEPVLARLERRRA